MLKDKNLTILIVVVLVLAVAVLAAVVVKKEYKQSGEVSILYALRGEASVEDNKLIINPELVEWFTDSPVRKAGRMEASELVDLWETDFKVSSPNAAIIGDNADAVLELVNASLNNGQINFTFSKIIDGNLGVGSIGDVSIFIDDSSYTLHIDIDDSAVKNIDQKDQTLEVDQ